MKILVLMHKDLIPPEVKNKKEVDWDRVPWVAEYDVLTQLKKAGHSVEVLGVFSDLTKIREVVDSFDPKVVFNILEEFDGEAIFDQNVVSYLELLRIPYTGCNPRGLILARDKALSKKILTYHRIPTPKFQVFPRNQPRRKVNFKKFPAIVKCLNEEASLGISKASIVHDPEKALERVHFLHDKFSADAILEEFIEGEEYFVGVMGNFRLQALPVWKLSFKKAKNPEKEFYSSSAKFDKNYRKRKGVSTGSANLDKDLESRLQNLAKKTYKALGLSGYARIDMRVTKEGKIYVLEANPNPDISREEDFALSALKEGLSYEKLLDKLLNLGIQWSPTAPPPIVE